MNNYTLSIAIVTYCADRHVFSTTLRTLNKAVKDFERVKLTIIDHSPSLNDAISGSDVNSVWDRESTIILDPSNPGFGIGHNRAIPWDFKYHLILNPDVEISADALKIALQFMEANPECGLLTPYATWDGGIEQRLCKRYPTVFDLLLRGFAPGWMRRVFNSRLSRYEMSDHLNNQDVLWDPLIVSGCFMLFRTDVFHKLKGFDPRFFLYFEDFDISLRTGKLSRIAYVPMVKIVHHGGHSSRKGWRHLIMFGRSMVTFFNIHGWRWW
ncbi:glycosyl transferase [Aeromonas schubertii]|uniref:glycosyl transferase n=1 Tax=Aeromonas schubertii TaxID=652 RepID=UPI0009EA17B6|nr:glycosyl transferase [Aeromonas schubertii]